MFGVSILSRYFALRGVTPALSMGRGPPHFNPRPLYGGDLRGAAPGPDRPISIHTPLAGGDLGAPCYPTFFAGFQSTPPLRGATSILAMSSKSYRFQSTPPLRGATFSAIVVLCLLIISIHAPLAGGDTATTSRRRTFAEFQSTPPLRGATSPAPGSLCICRNFNPRPPCGGRRSIRIRDKQGGYDFNPRPPCGGRLFFAREFDESIRFQSTPPLRGATGWISPGPF